MQEDFFFVFYRTDFRHESYS